MALSTELRDALNHAFRQHGNFGPKAGPGRDAMRGMLRDAVAAGLSNDECLALLNPAYYRGINDPFGGGQLVEDLTPEQLHAQAVYAAGCTGNGLTRGGSTGAQSDWFDAFPDMLARYIELADE